MKNKIYTGMLLGCFLLCGCSDWLDVKPYLYGGGIPKIIEWRICGIE